MKNFLTIVVTVSILNLVSFNFLFAQDELSKEAKERIEAERIAFLTKKIDLTPQESQQFWPIYNQYRKELESVRSDKKDLLHDAKKNYENTSDADIEKALLESFNMEQRELDIKKKYYYEMKKAISPRKVVKLYRAERQWTLLLVQRLKELQSK
jgi:Spy/CpxP family protein refolding chaperone